MWWRYKSLDHICTHFLYHTMSKILHTAIQWSNVMSVIIPYKISMILLGKDTRFFFLQVAPGAHFNKYNATSPINNVHRSSLIPQGRPASKLLSIHGKKTHIFFPQGAFAVTMMILITITLVVMRTATFIDVVALLFFFTTLLTFALVMMLVVVVLMTTLVLSVSRHGYLKSCKKPAIAIENTRDAIHNANPQDRKISIVEKAKMLENFFPLRTKTTSLNIRIRTNISCLCSSKLLIHSNKSHCKIE